MRLSAPIVVGYCQFNTLALTMKAHERYAITINGVKRIPRLTQIGQAYLLADAILKGRPGPELPVGSGKQLIGEIAQRIADSYLP
jgi:hypothetical protein